MKELLRVIDLGNQVVMVQVQQDLDWATAPQFKERMLSLLTSSNKAVLVQLRPGLLVDSSGLAAIGTLQTRAMGQRAPFAVICADLNLRRLFKLTGLDDFVPVYHSISEGYANILVSLAAA